MKFKISRTSVWDGRPCDEAYEDKMIRLDVRHLGSFEEYDKDFTDKWTDRGENHCVNENGVIQREFEQTEWFIDINSLDELIEFKNKYGEVVIANSWENPNIPEIEIYDDYRE